VRKLKIIREFFIKCAFLAAVAGLLAASVLAEGRLLVPGGHTIGIRAYADGLVVVSVEQGSAAQKAGIRQGDLLCSVDGEKLDSASQLTQRLDARAALRLELRRGGKCRTVLVTPDRTEDGCRLGASVRDHIAGIGTVTYYDPESGEFGALGHGICDLGGKGLLTIHGGDVVPSRVREVVRGVSGCAGQLKGEFDAAVTLGSLSCNTDSGVFGTIKKQDGTAIPTGLPQPGRAQIYANVSGDEVSAFDVEILRCYHEEESGGRDMLLRITDPELLSITGGIVQGMSGSPIIQDGKLVGAVTHVLVNDPQTGYGIFIENMLEAAS